MFDIWVLFVQCSLASIWNILVHSTLQSLAEPKGSRDQQKIGERLRIPLLAARPRRCLSFTQLLRRLPRAHTNLKGVALPGLPLPQ